MNYLLILIVTALFSIPAQADSYLSQDLGKMSEMEGTLVAQDSYDAYDPFADYSEFQEASEEEADIFFFKNGRFFSLSVFGGYRSFTGTFNEIYNSNAHFGLGLSYFFDLQFALLISYSTGSHPFKIESNVDSQTGNISMSNIAFDVKYYLNTQNVTKGLASINPYVAVGFAQVSLTKTTDGDPNIAKDGALGFQFTLGTEFPLMANKMFIGFEGQYQIVNIPGESSNIIINDVDTGVKPAGDVIKANAIIGINF